MKLINSDSKYTMLQKISFQINAVLLNSLFIKKPWGKNYIVVVLYGSLFVMHGFWISFK